MSLIPQKEARRTYNISDSPTLQHYISDFTSDYCGVMSHVNSGKTSCMCVKSQVIAMNQHPDINGVRHSAHLFVRGTHGELIRSTVRTFEQWVDPELVPIRKSPPVWGRLRMQPLGDQNKHFPQWMYREGKRFPYKIGAIWDPGSETFEGGEEVGGVRIGDIWQNGTHVDALFDFLALDNPDWEAALLGTEYTCAYMDEPDSMSNIEEVMPKLPSRLGRFPPPDVAPITCSQINLSFNPPIRGSFTQRFFDSNDKSYGKGRKLYRIQPPLLMIPDPLAPQDFHKAQFIRNPDAEGVRYAGKGFKHWEDLVESSRHDPDKIRRDVLGEWTQGSGGALIHSGFNVDKHVVPTLLPAKNHKLLVSLDWGMSGAALYLQYDGMSLKCIEEQAPVNQMSHEFVKDRVLPHINTEYRGYDIVITGDPSGRYRRDVGEGPFEIFRELGYLVEDETAMDPEERWSAVNLLLRLDKGLIISEACTWLIEGFTGKYTFKKQRNGVIVRQADKTKQHSAFQDALQAAACLVTQGYESASSNSAFATSRNRAVETEDEENFVWV